MDNNNACSNKAIWIEKIGKTSSENLSLEPHNYFKYLNADRLRMTVQKVENDLYSVLNYNETKRLESSECVRHFASKSGLTSTIPGKVIEQKQNSSTQGSARLKPNQESNHQFPKAELSSEDLKWLGKKNVKKSKEYQFEEVKSNAAFPVEDFDHYESITAKKNHTELHHKAECLLHKIRNQEDILGNKLADMSLLTDSSSSVSSLIGLPARCVDILNAEEIKTDDKGNEIRTESSDVLSNVSLLDEDWFNQLLKIELEL